MIIGFHKTFNKQFAQLSSQQKKHVTEILLLFQKDPFHPSLRNHPLKGEWAQYRSLSAGGDLRLHYRIVTENEVLFVALGSHSQLYR